MLCRPFNQLRKICLAQCSSVSEFPHHCLINCIPSLRYPHVRNPLALPEFCNTSLPACHGLWTPADLHTLAFPGVLVWPWVHGKTLGVRGHSFRSCTSTSGCAASPLRPTGCSVYASAVLFTAFQRLRHRRKTRYGWMSSPYPTGTSTPQGAPSLSRRDNASANRRAAVWRVRVERQVSLYTAKNTKAPWLVQ